MVIKNGQVLLGRRKGGSHDGLYAFPGGLLEWHESFVDCAKRELLEECGQNFAVTEPRFFCVHNVIDRQHSKHYLLVVMHANWLAGEPQNIEPNKCAGWEWFAAEKLPVNLFDSNRQTVINWSRLASK